jgi:hypothetical protein
MDYYIKMIEEHCLLWTSETLGQAKDKLKNQLLNFLEDNKGCS